MTRKTWAYLATAAVVATGATVTAMAQQGGFGNLMADPLAMVLADQIETPAADAQTRAIVAAAEAYLATLSEEQRAASVFAFDDMAQRTKWSNFPDGAVQRSGVPTGDMTADQRAALDALLSTVLSDAGVRNVQYQMAAEESLNTGGGRVNFSDAYYYTSFVGAPALDAPWMLQFGGHHLAINVTVNGADVSFAPMLTGGEPLNITYEGQAIYITQDETAAAQALMDSLSDAQKNVAVRGSNYIQLLTGPGDEGVVLPPEGISGADLSDAQQALLLDVIKARIGFMNADDFSVKMAQVEAGLDQTYFGWWGPEGVLGGAYFRVTGPDIVMEYSPQAMDGDPTNHAHNMYREPGNDYGAAWIAQ